MDKAKLEQKLGKLQLERMQIESQIKPLQERFNKLTVQSIETANEIMAIKPEEKQHGEGTD